MPDDSPEVAAAIRELAQQVDALGNAMIKQQNPEMTDDLLAYSAAAMKRYGIVDSGDASTLGVGAMTARLALKGGAAPVPR